MRQRHNNWFTRIFSYPVVVEDLLCSFVDEAFVKELDFESLKKLDTNFVPTSERSRHADIIYEITAHGQPSYIYLFIEFQSTVDWFMPLRMARYIFEFYDELRRSSKQKFFNPPFAILLYNGDHRWNAPERFSGLLYNTPIPKEYLPEFRYFKLAINEIPKRDLVKLRNSASAVFYIEDNNPAKLNENWDELVYILKGVIKRACGVEVIQELMNRIFRIYQLPENSKLITGIDDLLEVKNMLETKIRNWEREIFEKGIEKGIRKGIEKGVERGIERGIEKGIEKGIDIGVEVVARKMIQSGENNLKISLYTGLSIEQIEELRNRIKNEDLP